MSLLSPAFKKKLAELQKAEKAANILDLKIKDLSADAALLAGSSLPPPFGTAADVASLAKSVATGDWGGAFWDAVGFIPIVGDGAKAAVKGTKIARRLKAINKSLDKARDIIRKKKEDLAKLCKKKRVKNKGNTTKAAEDCGTVNCGEGNNTTEKKIGSQKYTIDEQGRTVKAEGVIDGSHKGRKKKYVPEPAGGRDVGDHRGHMIPEGGVDDVKSVNVKPNIVSESAQSNLGLKKKFDLKASKTKDQFPDSKVTTEHTPRVSKSTFWLPMNSPYFGYHCH